MSNQTKEPVVAPASYSAAEREPQYIFTETQDWFSHNIDTWRSFLPHVTSPAPRVLEIGSWEGRSAIFMLTELCGSRGSLVCIDHFDLMKTEAGRKRYAQLQHNLTLTGKPFRVVSEFSVPALMSLLQEAITADDPGFDWIYVDGSHRADDTFLDGELAWRLAKKGAVIVFDDYLWDQEPVESIHHPKRGVDSFILLHAGEFEIISSPDSYQMVLQKTSEMRIGFLMKEAESVPSMEGFDHGMHVALVVDSSYAMPAAVAIRSTLVHTGGRITFYVVDLGLSKDDKDRIEEVIRLFPNATLRFFQLPKESLAADMGLVWAKIDMISVLPVERVLYLDADILVRADLRDLWDTDLQEKAIGATVDVGHPMGHASVQREPYFNAGVMLMNLAKVRLNVAALESTARKMKNFAYMEQDALNVHFRDDWCALDLRWNAQGLGTYANCPSPERDALNLSTMGEGAIVHFTGPVNPAMEDVLNPHVQPYTSKPWGYAGAPGHPFREEWWAALDQTGWKGWRRSDEHSAYCLAKQHEASKVGVTTFSARVLEAI
ncbi:hypothetical protein PHLCEN_2v2222 [Hermanssonia centrifuga]|uniref:Glycosyltransferase family 8 protein n=1 Tax=Hermanssonia centrifuga TaxID=98765 RepID=A0A2R6RPM4_9APHY|nr:hypothetical protein PHLCEN_2v2222 [Hermanssonia centrifuga]